MQQSHVNYQVIENELSNQIQQELTEKLKSKHWTSGAGVRSVILKFVVMGQYDEATEELKAYVDSRTDYADFQKGVRSYVKHASELVAAIENKRNLPGLGALSLSKRQELSEKVEAHFEDLKHYLKQIEKVERSSRLADARTTVWVLQALWQSALVIFVVGFFSELNVGTYRSLQIITNQLLDDVSGFLLRLLGF